MFCAHGAGFTVKWDKVPEYMHLESCLRPERPDEAPALPRVYTRNLDIDEKELEAIFQRTFGPIRNRAQEVMNQVPASSPRRTIAPPSSST